MKGLTIAPVVRADVIGLVDMILPDEQAAFVAPNAVSLAQAAYEPGAYPFCIRRDGDIVGLVQVIDMRLSDRVEDGDDADATYLWRLMIATKHQGQGIGRAVMGWFEDWARARGTQRLILSVVPDNRIAERLYRSCGFIPTGRIEDGEVEYEKRI